MRAVFGVVGLLVVLAIVGIAAKKQLQASVVSPGTAAPAASAGNVAQQSRRIQQQVQADVTKALEQGAAAARQDETDK